MGVETLSLPVQGQVVAADPRWVVRGPDAGRTQRYHAVPRDGGPATAFAPVPAMDQPLIALAGDTLWVVEGGVSEGELRVQRATEAACAEHLVVPAGCDACMLRATVVAASDDGLWIGGWVGRHSDQVAFVGWAARLDAAGAVVTDLALDALGDEGPAWETSVDALVPAAGGALVAGHYAATGSADRDRIWVARVGGAATWRHATQEGDPDWQRGHMVLAAEGTGTQAIWRVEGGARALRADADQAAARALAAPSGPWTGAWWAGAPPALTVAGPEGLWRGEPVPLPDGVRITQVGSGDGALWLAGVHDGKRWVGRISEPR